MRTRPVAMWSLFSLRTASGNAQSVHKVDKVTTLTQVSKRLHKGEMRHGQPPVLSVDAWALSTLLAFMACTGLTACELVPALDGTSFACGPEAPCVEGLCHDRLICSAPRRLTRRPAPSPPF